MNNIYPDEITLEGEKLDFLINHSELIRTYYEIEGTEDSLTLNADVLFEGDKTKWKLFYDLFFPEEGKGKLFTIVGSNIYVKESRGGKEALKDLMDYLLVDSPKTMFEFAKDQARQNINIPRNILSTTPKAKGKVNLSIPRNLRNMNYNQMNYNNNNNSNNYNNVKLGYTKEEEEYLRKIAGTNAKKYYPNERRKTNRHTRRNINNMVSRRMTRTRKNRK